MYRLFMFLVIALLMSLAMAVIVVNLAHVDRLDSQPSSLQLILLKLELMFLMIAVLFVLVVAVLALSSAQILLGGISGQSVAQAHSPFAASYSGRVQTHSAGVLIG
ncbi:uncharacterized protein [Anabrus simplex]|uniref:uncharacterized protein isoform X2 n=1 Tax=Anabrus simplex TaxID=316456 RepID=UPI0035A324A1